MKWTFFFLLIPFASSAQTVHLKDDNIFYEGSLKISAAKVDLQTALKEAEKNSSTPIHTVSILTENGQVTTVCQIQLRPTQSTVNTLQYTLQLAAKEDYVKYKIENFFLITKERGGKTDTISSKDVVKDMDVTGPVATATEKKLNEIDMRIEQLIDLLRNYLSK